MLAIHFLETEPTALRTTTNHGISMEARDGFVEGSTSSGASKPVDKRKIVELQGDRCYVNRVR